MVSSRLTWVTLAVLPLIQLVNACVFDNVDLSRLPNRRFLSEFEIKHRTPPPASTELVAITNVQIFKGSSTLTPGTVLLNGPVIGAILPPGVPPPYGYQTFDGKNGVLLPGLIDSHCHPNYIDQLEALTSYGVTTAIGMGCIAYAQCNAVRNQTGLASFITTGIPIVAPGSPHAMLFGTPAGDTISSVSQAPELVQQIIGNNSAFVKMVAEPKGPSQAMLNALVQQTHQAGYKAATHATYLENYMQAIASGTDAIQHVPVDGPVNTTMINQILKQGQYVVPTLNAFKYLLAIPGLASPGSTYASAEESVTLLHNNGVKLLTGTDSFVETALGLSIPFGIGLHDEFQYLVQAGMTPLQVLLAATIVAAQTHSLSDRGAILPGLRADLLLIQGNPLTNISNTLNIQAVWVDGLKFNGTLG